MESLSNKKAQSLLIGGEEIEFKELIHQSIEQYKLAPYYLHTLSFIKDWLTGKEVFHLKTSGSTGVPKEITFSRAQMVYSAEATLKALQLSARDSALICLNTQYVAGTMMLVRSMISGMKMTIIEPISNPLKQFSDLDHFDFTAWVPLQLETVLEHLPEKQELFNKFKSIIVGGAAVSHSLRDKLNKVSVPVYATYGMTETLSHIALQKLNGSDREEYFTAFDEVKLSLDERKCLVIHSPVTLGEKVVTNDLVQLIDQNKFCFLGRYDHVINSGGVKIFPEKVEECVDKAFNELNISPRFFIYGLPNERLGQQITLFIEGKPFPTNELRQKLSVMLSDYQQPREIRFVDTFAETSTGKINRKASIAASFGSV